MWEEVWFMSSLASHNTIINCNCHPVSIHSPPCTLGIHAFCLLFPLTYKLIIRASLALSTYGWILPLHPAQSSITWRGPLSSFSSPEEWADIGPCIGHPALPSFSSPGLFRHPPPHVAYLPFLQIGRGGLAGSQKQCPNMRWPWIMRGLNMR